MLSARILSRLLPVCRSALATKMSLSEQVRSTEVSLTELKQLIEKKDVLLVDVREPAELESNGVLPGAINIPLGEVPYALSLSPEAFERRYGIRFEPEKLVFSCKAGGRSERARQAAEKEGYHQARHFSGGFDLWSQSHSDSKGNK